MFGASSLGKNEGTEQVREGEGGGEEGREGGMGRGREEERGREGERKGGREGWGEGGRKRGRVLTGLNTSICERR